MVAGQERSHPQSVAPRLYTEGKGSVLGNHRKPRLSPCVLSFGYVMEMHRKVEKKLWCTWRIHIYAPMMLLLVFGQTQAALVHRKDKLLALTPRFLSKRLE